MDLATRNDIPDLLNSLCLRGQGVEVGVKEGRCSAHLLQHWAGERLISVDPWQEQDREAYRDMANVRQPQHDLYYRRTMARLARYRDRSTIWRMTSEEAAAQVPPRGLEFVYLDARHDYSSVMQDLELWIPKLLPGAVFAGHDYIDGVFPGVGEFGVRSAVNEFFGRRSLPVHSTRDDGPFVSWIVRLPDQ